MVWKFSKIYLQLKLGKIEISPKQVYKTMYIAKLIDENLYRTIFQTIKDRNKVSLTYKEEM